MSRAGTLAVAARATANPTRNRPTHREDGAAAVEMALVLPLLLFVLFGIVDFGRMLNAQITLTEAAREGARAAAIYQSADARVQAATKDSLGGATVSTTVTACTPGGSTLDNAVVTASATFTFITPLAALAPLFGGSLNSTQTVTGRGIMPCVG